MSNIDMTAGPTPFLLGPPREPGPAHPGRKPMWAQRISNQENWNPISNVDLRFNGQHSIIEKLEIRIYPYTIRRNSAGPQTLFRNFKTPASFSGNSYVSRSSLSDSKPTRFLTWSILTVYLLPVLKSNSWESIIQKKFRLHVVKSKYDLEEISFQ